jgi:outer membrane biosynthesis protein TonB
VLSKLIGVLVAALISLCAAHNRQQTAPPTPQPERWPSPGVHLPGAGVTAPKALSRGGPTYTAEARRAKIQGVVVVACVVQADGTVGAVQVRQSLGSASTSRLLRP